jgi:hypothetical protein
MGRVLMGISDSPLGLEAPRNQWNILNLMYGDLDGEVGCPMSEVEREEGRHGKPLERARVAEGRGRWCGGSSVGIPKGVMSG